MGDEQQEGISAGQAGELSATEPSTSEVERLDIHKPKPVHGWREFVNEIGVIVIGVLIALGAEQAVEALHWRHQVEAGEDALDDDMRRLVASAAEREAQSPCIAQRLQAVAAVLDGAKATGRLPAVGQLGSPSSRGWSLAAWSNLVASGVPTHMSRQRMLAYSNLADDGMEMARISDEERQAWTTLYTIVGPGRPFGDAEQAAVRAALSRATLAAKDQRHGAVKLRDDVTELGLLSAGAVTAIRRKAAADYAVAARKGIMCKPLAEAPPATSYGQAPSPVDLSAPFQP